MAKSNGIKSLKQAAKLLNRHSPDGESLAYINPEEAKLLRSHGGTGIQTLQGVPSYAKLFGYQVPFTGKKSWGEVAGDVYTWLGYGKQPAGKGEDDEQLSEESDGSLRRGVTDRRHPDGYPCGLGGQVRLVSNVTVNRSIAEQGTNRGALFVDSDDVLVQNTMPVALVDVVLSVNDPLSGDRVKETLLIPEGKRQHQS